MGLLYTPRPPLLVPKSIPECGSGVHWRTYSPRLHYPRPTTKLGKQPVLGSTIDWSNVLRKNITILVEFTKGIKYIQEDH